MRCTSADKVSAASAILADDLVLIILYSHRLCPYSLVSLIYL